MGSESVEIKSEARGSHWVAWVTRTGQAAQAAPILIVGQTREEAEERMDTWWRTYETGSGRQA